MPHQKYRFLEVLEVIFVKKIGSLKKKEDFIGFIGSEVPLGSLVL